MSALKDRNGTQKTRNPYFIGAPHKIALYRRIIVLIKECSRWAALKKASANALAFTEAWFRWWDSNPHGIATNGF